jgi:hypothetical protein
MLNVGGERERESDSSNMRGGDLRSDITTFTLLPAHLIFGFGFCFIFLAIVLSCGLYPSPQVTFYRSLSCPSKTALVNLW